MRKAIKLKPRSNSELVDKWYPPPTTQMLQRKAETRDLKFHSLWKHSHLVPKNENQQLGKRHWALL